MSKTKLYLWSGLGADERAFSKIVWPNNLEPIVLPWQVPEKEMGFEAYCAQYKSQLDTKTPFYLGGLSMGGMVAAQISQWVPLKGLLLFSSVAAPQELPPWFAWFHQLKITSIVPPALLKNASLAKRIFAGEKADNKRIIADMVRDAPSDFLSWSIKAIPNWQINTSKGTTTENLTETIPHSPIKLHIHGEKDRILPMKYTHPTHIIPRAGHMMILENAQEVSEILHQFFEKEQIF